MRFDLLPYGKPFHLFLGIQVLRPVNLRLTVFDSETKRIYSERDLKLARHTKVRLKLPIVPDRITVELIDKNLPRRGSVFRIGHIKVTSDLKCPSDLTDQDKKFIRFAKWFATESSRLDAGERGTIYQSDGFTIVYSDRFITNGVEETTPAKIGKDSGFFYVSRRRTFAFTVPMIIVMLCHEYAHKFKNKKYGKKESNELAADLIACHMTLNLGFDEHEIIQCFEEVFTKKKNKKNKKRMAAIKEFIVIFKQNEAKRCKVKK